MSDRNPGRVVVTEPQQGNPATAGMGVRWDPNKHYEPQVMIEQLWPPTGDEDAGRAEPVYVEEGALYDLIHELMAVHLAIMEASDE